MGMQNMFKTALRTTRKATVTAAAKAEETIHTLRVVQGLLVTALLLLAATVAVSLIIPAWAPYAYAVGAVILAIPLVAILVMLWKPLHSRPVRVLEQWAHAADGAGADVAALREELRETEKELRRVKKRVRQ